MSGMALYSRDRDIVGCCDFPSNMTVIANEERLKDRLAKLRGQLVSVGEEIDAWGLVWTGPTGRVEIEIVTPGPQYRFDRDTDVLDAHGGFTNRKRFLENSFFVMNPTYFEGGRITKAIGEVFVLRDPDGVKSFLPTVSAVWGSDAWSGEILRRWREALEQTELE